MATQKGTGMKIADGQLNFSGAETAKLVIEAVGR
jgi:hypothetical protein